MRTTLWMAVLALLAASAAGAAPGPGALQCTAPTAGQAPADEVPPPLQGPTQVGEVLRQSHESQRFDGPVGPGESQRAWQVELTFPGASYIAPHFSRFNLPPGAQLVVRAPDGSRSWSYTRFGKADHFLPEGFWGLHVPGDTAVVEIRSQVPLSPRAVVIDSFAHGYADAELATLGVRDRQLAPRAICGTDDSDWAKCYQTSEPTIYDESRAVARLLINGTSACTGWLVGDQGHLMTNHHCIGGSSDALNTDYEFMAEGATCGTNCASFGACPGTVAATSATLVQTDTNLDYTLVQLPTNVSSTYGFMQLRDTGAVNGERIYIPGHPAAWGKRFAVESSHSSNPSGFCEVDSLNQSPCIGGSTAEVGYYCDTQGGSSGSPVLAYSDHCVVALHHCANCQNRGVPIQAVISDLGSNLPANALCGGEPPPPPPPPPECPAGSIDFSSFSLTSYADQNVTNGVAVEDGGATLHLTGNTWVRSTQSFNVTANTVVELQFASGSQGEIHAIGFDENDTLNDSPRHFQFWGTQNWTGAGKAAVWSPQYSGSGSYESFTIPVGQYFTGGTMWLVFTNDKDSGTLNNEGLFRCVRVFEDGGGPPPGNCTVDDDFEGGAAGWVNDAASTCTTGDYVLATPTQVVDSGVTTQVGGDHTSGSGNALFTATNSSAGVDDVDGGVCILTSPTWSVADASNLTVWYFHGQRDAGDDPTGDYFRLEVSTNGGASYTAIASNGDSTSNAAWTQATASIPAGSSVRLRVHASDGAGPGDLVEAGIDDLRICPVP